MNTADTRPEKGSRYVWNEGSAGGAVYVEVTRVARDGAWADIRCTTVLHRGADRGTWTKRQRLPLPESFVPARRAAPLPPVCQIPACGCSGEAHP